MRSLLDQLDSAETILLLYVFDELDAVERSEVERRLERDEQWRATLDRLRAAHEAVWTGLRRSDAAEPLHGSPAPAVRQVARQIQQWHADRLAAAAAPQAPAKTLRFPWWSYPLAAAAAVVFAFMAWWYNLPDPSDQFISQNPPGMVDSAPRPDGESADGSVFLASLESLDDPRDLSDLEGQLEAVRALRESMQ